MNKSLKNHEEITIEQAKEAIYYSINQTKAAMESLEDDFKIDNSESNFYTKVQDKNSWTEGFYTGEIWMAYEMTGNPVFKELALNHVNKFKERIEKRVFVDHHDMGFLYSLSCVAAYKLVGSKEGKDAALMAANNLISRFQKVGDFIQAWGELGAKDNYRLIIDCLLNLPLLYWATEVTGDEKYADIAKKHIATSMKCIIRPDHSTYHTYFFDKETGAPLHGVTHQGNRDGSAWARGQAWGVYGVALSYRYTKNENYVKIFKQITDYFIEHLPEDLVPFWDFDFTDGSDQPRDSSSAAIAACGMLEMAKYMNDEDAKHYNSVALKIIKSLADNYAVKDPSVSNGQLLHGVYCKPTETNGCPEIGVDECNTWGDYYYVEALMRVLKPDWNLYW